MNRSTQPHASVAKFTRRQFLKSASAVAQAAAVPYFVPASVFGARAPSNRITLACIGVGNQGTPIMRRFLNQSGCQVVAVCDVNRGSVGYKDPQQFLGREPAQKMVNEFYTQQTGNSGYRGCSAHVDFRELLARDDIDAVTVCTPDHWHALMTIAAVEAGKDVYCEKPLALTIGEGRAIVDAVAKHQAVLQTGSHERSNPVARQACELVRNGYIGEVKTVLTHIGKNNRQGPGPGWSAMPVPDGLDYDRWLGPAPEAPYHQDRCLYGFRFIYDYAGGQVTNYGAHSNDLAQWGLGMDRSGPIEVEYLEATFLPEGSLYNAATQAKFRCRYANGTVLTCQTASPAVRAIFEGTEGRVQIDASGRNFETEPASLAAVKLRPEQLLHASDDHHRDFLDCIKSRQAPAAHAGIGHASATVCHLGNIAVRLKAKLAWDPASERFADNDAANAMLHRPLRAPWKI